jgi:hypothetical protein
VYSADPFNEMVPSSYEHEYLHAVSEAIYGGMSKTDADAIWSVGCKHVGSHLTGCCKAGFLSTTSAG